MKQKKLTIAELFNKLEIDKNLFYDIGGGINNLKVLFYVIGEHIENLQNELNTSETKQDLKEILARINQLSYIVDNETNAIEKRLESLIEQVSSDKEISII